MTPIFQTQGTIENLQLDYYLERQIELFIIDRRSIGLAKGSIKFYSQKLNLFSQFCNRQLITSILQIDANLLRQYLLFLDGRGNNQGGKHAHYRAIRAFLLWFEMEIEPDNWKNPIKKIKAPRVPNEILDPISIESINALVQTCNRSIELDLRDKAILLILYDTGLRASELLSLDRHSVDPNGSIFVHHGKGKKDRLVFLGKKSKSAIRIYLKQRSDSNQALFLSRFKNRLTYDGLRSILSKRSKLANIPPPTVHSFRRAFALEMLRTGTDVHSLAILMGHSNISVLAKYLKLNDADIRRAHKHSAPVDSNL